MSDRKMRAFTFAGTSGSLDYLKDTGEQRYWRVEGAELASVAPATVEQLLQLLGEPVVLCAQERADRRGDLSGREVTTPEIDRRDPAQEME